MKNKQENVRFKITLLYPIS